MKKFLAILLSISILLSFTACSNEDNTVYDDYSYGLDENGFYENLESYNIQLPDVSSMKVQVDDMLKYGLQMNSDGENAPTTVDEYMEAYANDLLSSLGMASKKESIVEGDIVTAQLRFILDGNELPDYASTNSYKASSDGDSIISSFIEKKYGDIYEVEYTFPEDDQYYPSTTMTVHVTIDDVLLENAIHQGVVEENAEILSLYIGDDITDAESLLTALRPRLASVLISAYLDTYFSELDIEVPKQLVEYEVYRFKARLQQVGYTYSKYLEDAVTTDKAVREYCASVAKNNMILMSIAKQENITVTDEEAKEYYGENFEYVHEMQGMPYMKLNMIRDLALYQASTKVILLDGETTLDRDAMFPDEDIPNVGEDSEIEQTQDSAAPTDSDDNSEKQEENTENVTEPSDS